MFKEILDEICDDSFDGTLLLLKDDEENDDEERGNKFQRKFIPQTIFKVIASKACRTAHMFGDKLDKKQMNLLLEGLGLCDKWYECAHGRPTIFPILDTNGVMPYIDS